MNIYKFYKILGQYAWSRVIFLFSTYFVILLKFIKNHVWTNICNTGMDLIIDVLDDKVTIIWSTIYFVLSVCQKLLEVFHLVTLSCKEALLSMELRK